MFAGLGKAGPALIHDVVVGKGDDLDAAGLEGVDKGDRGVKHEGFGAAGVGGGDRGLHVDETEVGAMEDVGDVAEEGGPALHAVSAGSRRGADRLVGNDVAGHGEGDLGERMGKRHRRGSSGAMESGDQGGDYQQSGGCANYARAFEPAPEKPVLLSFKLPPINSFVSGTWCSGHRGHGWALRITAG